jgi:hypothetical protein
MDQAAVRPPGAAAPAIVDGHVHLQDQDHEAALLAIAAAAGIGQMGLAAIQGRTRNEVAPALCLKDRHPGRFFLFAGLNHAARRSAGRVRAPDPAEQVARFAAIGCDGIKLIESKPSCWQELKTPLSDAYFAPFWERVAALDLPVLWHVADPEEFWDPATTPAWARQRNWGYGPETVPKEQLYAEVERVLERHPGLRIVFPHFFFLSADLERTERFLAAHPAVRFDLAPGIELLYNLSRDPARSREFFVRHASRIVFGSDIWSGLTAEQGAMRAQLVRRWLESDDTFRVPPGADMLLGPPEDGIVRGLALPAAVLARIYAGNFAQWAGATPRPLDRGGAAEECARLGAIEAALTGRPAAVTAGARAAAALRS